MSGSHSKFTILLGNPFITKTDTFPKKLILIDLYNKRSWEELHHSVCLGCIYLFRLSAMAQTKSVIIYTVNETICTFINVCTNS